MMLFKKANINTLLSIFIRGFLPDKINSGISKLIEIHDFENKCDISQS
jgi:hypothetical protein